ncbi:MAG: glutamate-cysteine ligase family protein [Streptosporangiaceae bacterium]
MTVPRVAPNPVAVGPLGLEEPLTVDAGFDRCCQAALQDSVIGPVGLEIETHLVDLDRPGDRVGWARVEAMLGVLPGVAGRNAITVEPGGQLELSGPPDSDAGAAAIRLRHDVQAARLALAELRLGLAHAGADPVRSSRRVNPRSRYQAMEQHMAATGRGDCAAVMMNSTAALQVNLDAGPRRGWASRVALANRLGPTLLAMSACSPWLHGRDTGWKSARQRAWAGLDPRACGPVAGCVARSPAADDDLDPASAWARYALAAPVTFVRTTRGEVSAVSGTVSFGQWASGAVRLGHRAPTAADLDVHLTTLFPPVRLRGYLELRYLDMTPPRWWPGIAAVAATLMDDPVAADHVIDATEQTAELWTEAARDGLGHAALADSARRCVGLAAGRVPAALASAVADLAELIESGRCPGDLLAERITEIGPLAAFAELAHA